MRKCALAFALVLLASGSARAARITGTLLRLQGDAIPELEKEADGTLSFTVVAVQGINEVGRGGLISAKAPFQYQIDIDESKLSTDNVQVTLIFSGRGLTRTPVGSVAGKVNVSGAPAQVIHAIVPREGEGPPTACPCSPEETWYFLDSPPRHRFSWFRRHQ